MVPLLGRPVVLGAALALTGCGAGSTGTVEQVVDRFGSAWEARDGAAVCALLAPEARAEVEGSTRQACERGVLEEDLTAPGAAVSTEVWGDSAQVRAAEDTVFLARFPSGWKVMAAGCEPQPDKPYDCQVQGG